MFVRKAGRCLKGVFQEILKSHYNGLFIVQHIPLDKYLPNEPYVLGTPLGSRTEKTGMLQSTESQRVGHH